MSTLLNRRLGSFTTAFARNYPGKYPRPKPGTSERPPYRAPDPLVNNPAATVTSLPEDDLTFIHRPPPTAPTPHSFSTSPSSALLRESSAADGPLPPPIRPSAEKQPLPRVSDEVVAKIRQLRLSDPVNNTRGKLARQFGVSQAFVGMVAAVSKSTRKQLTAARDVSHEASRQKWSEKHKLVMDIRKKRKEFW